MNTTEFELPTSITKSSGQRFFPAHLTPFESYMLIDDRPKYPTTFILQFDFSGNLERNAFKASVEEALERHPLMRAIIRRAKLNRDCWVDAGNVRPMVHFGELDQPLEFPGVGVEKIDLRSEIGLRIWVRHNERQAVVTTQFHHAVCDGIGAYQFLGDVLWSYSTRMGDNEIEDAPRLSFSRLRNRGLVSYDPNQFLNDDGRFHYDWKHLAGLLFGRNATLRPQTSRPQTSKRSKKSEPYPFPGILSFEFDKIEHRRLRLAAQERGQTVNDLLLEKLFVTLNQWNKLNRNRLSGGKLCVMMPMDLREQNLEKMPACNVLTNAFIRRGGELLEQPEKLKESLREEIVLVKLRRHRTDFMNLIVGARRYPLLLKAFLSRGHCLATAILSNAGDPTKRFLVDFSREKGLIRCGNLLLTDISGVPPMRIKTRATISVFTYRRVLKICLRCDPHFFNIEDTQVLLEQYVGKIKSVLS